MKVTSTKSFQPVTIVLETERELEMLKETSGSNVSVASQVHGYQHNFSRSELSSFLGTLYSQLRKV